MEKITTGMEKVSVGEEKLKEQPLAAKTKGGNRGRGVNVVTNLSQMRLAPNIAYFLYDLRMYALYPKLDTSDGENAKMRELTKQTKDDFPEQERKQKTVAIFTRLLKDHKDFFGDDQGMLSMYDRAAILISLKELPIPQGQSKVFDKKFDYVPGFSADCLGVKVVIKKSQKDDGTGFQVTSNDIKNATNIRAGKMDKTILEVLNLAVSQEAFFKPDKFITYGNGVHYLFDPFKENLGFRSADCPQLNDGKYVGIGAAESVKILENGPMVVTEVKKTAFHSDGLPLMEKIAIMDLFADHRSGGSTFAPDRVSPHQKREIEKQLKGLYVTTTYEVKGRKTSVQVTRLGDSPSTIQVATKEGGRCSLQDYYKRTYGITLKYPKFFTIDAGRERYYPCELLVLSESQRVISNQQTPDQIATMIKACAALPADRLRQTESMKNQLGLNSKSKRLQQYGLTISDQLTSVKGRVLPTPAIMFGNKQIVNVRNNCDWKNNTTFFTPATISKYAIVGLLSQYDQRGFNINQYVGKLIQQCKMRGMNIGQLAFQEVASNPNAAAVEQYFQRALNEKVTYILFITSDMLKLHGVIKLNEVKTQILSQEVKVSKANGVIQKGQVQTLDNVVAKVNLKNDGFNYMVYLNANNLNANENMWLNSPRRCFIGLEISNPPALAAFEVKRGATYRMPSVLGWSSNCSTHPQKFVGDYIYIEPRQSDMMGKSLRKLTSDILRRFRANRDNVAPDHLYFYFSGVSDGQWNLVPDRYMEEVKNGLRDLSPQYQPHLTAVVCSKLHNERLYKDKIEGTRSAEQNIAPGTVVDSGITSPVISEFYLNAHSAFQGTAKTPKYSVLVDTTKQELDFHEGITHGLCFLHEIVNMTVSVPAPLIVADRCAKRGHDIFKAAHFEGSSSNNDVLDVEAANQQLTNAGNAAANGGSLINKRFNA